MSFLGNALIAKIKNMYSQSLKPEDYQDLLRKRTIYDVAMFLKKHPAYKDILANVPEGSLNRGRLEGLIKRQRFNNMIKILKFVTLKDESFYRLSFVQMEHETILTIIRAIISHEDYDVVELIPYYFDKYSTLDFLAMTKATDIASLVAALDGTRYAKMLKPYANVKNEDIHYYEFEALFEADYYKYAFENIKRNYKGKLRTDLDDAFKTRIEIENMIKVYRLKKFYGVKSNDIKSILIPIPTSRISEKKLDEIIAIKNPDDIFKKIVELGIGPYLTNKDQVYLEYFGDYMRFVLARKFIYFATDAAKVFQGYAFYSELETQNLTHIIEGIRYQISESEIRTMLVF